MRRFEMVKSPVEFNNIIKTGKYLKNNYFVIYYLKNNVTYPRFGLAIGTKLGHAYLRNKYKRQLRCIIDANKKTFSNGFDYIIMMKKTCSNLKYIDLFNEFVKLLKEIK